MSRYDTVRNECLAIIGDTGSEYAVSLSRTIESIGNTVRDFEIPPAEIEDISEELQRMRDVLRKRFRYAHKEGRWIARYTDEPIRRNEMKDRLVPRYYGE